jgi:hypothetical protein
MTCPKCGAEQEGGSECRQCGIIFDRVRQPRPFPEGPVGHEPVGGPGWEANPARAAVPIESALHGMSMSVPADASGPGPFRRFYRVFRWVLLACLSTVLVLILWTAAPPNVARDPEAPRRLEMKLQQFAVDASLGHSPPLRLDEAEVNSWMATNLALAAKPAARPVAGPAGPEPAIPLDSPTSLTVEEAQSNVRDVKVHMAGDVITAYVLFHLYGKDLSLTLEGRLSAQDGYLRLSPTRMRLGSLPIPQVTVDRAMASLFDSPQNRDRFRLPPDIRDLSVDNGELVVTWR